MLCVEFRMPGKVKLPAPEVVSARSGHTFPPEMVGFIIGHCWQSRMGDPLNVKAVFKRRKSLETHTVRLRIK